MFVACYIVIMVIAVVGAVIFGLSTGMSGWQTTAAAGGILVAGQMALLTYVVIRMVFRHPASANRPDSRRGDDAPRPDAHSERSAHRP